MILLVVVLPEIVLVSPLLVVVCSDEDVDLSAASLDWALGGEPPNPQNRPSLESRDSKEELF